MLFFNVSYFFLCINQFVFHADQSVELELRADPRRINDLQAIFDDFGNWFGPIRAIGWSAAARPGRPRGAEDLQIRTRLAKIRLELAPWGNPITLSFLPTRLV